ncbi:MAG: TetR/AcrR family transcriptional regulator [Acidimicrobiales bacterium]|nr:TetR/AcrR family transcriptional regulator [Acidimicrobiales bacterium]
MASPTPAGLPRSLLVGAPRPLLSSRAEAALGHRHREVLDGLEALLRAGELAALTIGALAARLECSRRTLYELAPSKDQLFILTLDRFMHRIGREAVAAIDPHATTATQLRQYATTNLGYAFRSAAYDDLADVPGARRVLDQHYRFAATVLQRIVARGMEQGEFRPVAPSVVAAVVLASTVHLGQPDIIDDLGIPLDTAVEIMLDLCLHGLQAGRAH